VRQEPNFLISTYLHSFNLCTCLLSAQFQSKVELIGGGPGARQQRHVEVDLLARVCIVRVDLGQMKIVAQGSEKSPLCHLRIKND
jgi:hypothetical protein